MHRGDCGDAQGVTLAATYGHPLVERSPLGGASAALPGMSRVTGSSRAGASFSTAVRSGRRSATAVRIAPRLTPC